jgi:hypothetical protein
MKITSILTTALAVSALVTSSAEAKTCHQTAKLAGPDDALMTPDFKVDLRQGESITVPLSLADAFTDYKAYGWWGAPTRQYACSARKGVDQWDEWRFRDGRVVARFDGITFTAVRPTLIYGWES